VSTNVRLTRLAPSKTFLSVLLGGASGICYAFLIPLVLSVIEPGGGGLEQVEMEPTRIASVEIANPGLAAVFALCCLFILVARTASQLLLNRAATDIASELRSRLYRRVLQVPLLALESVGMARLTGAVTTDVPRIVLGARMLPDLLVSCVTLFGMLAFLLASNSDVFWFVLLCVLFGAVTFQIPMLIGQHYFRRSRAAQDDLYQAFSGLVGGIKELKLNAPRRQAFMSDILLSHEARLRTAEKAGNASTTIATNYGDLLSFFVIGFIIFVFVNYHAISPRDLVGVVMVMLYVTSPVAIILRSIPQVAISRVSLRKFDALLDALPREELSHPQEPREDWRSIRLDRLVFRYPGDEPGFALGPLDLAIHRGELTFIVGGNGSGKSTLGKVLALHYAPTEGRIFFGGRAITPACLDSYRQSIAAVHTNYHLFEGILGVEGDVASMVDTHLKRLGLEHKVSYRDGRFSTLALSDGQRRRLALLVAIMEDRDLYLFDEWAADQDPDFRAFFYEDILPSLRRAGKTVIVITHDDRYFHLADQLVFMESGRVKGCVRPNAGPTSLATAS
jgi:putative ATP-binding cassette transporter